MKKDEDKLLLKQIKKGNKQAFNILFKKYYQQLVRFANGYMRDGANSEEMVQDVMVNLWEQAAEINIDISVQAYLYASVRNRALNAIKHEKIKQRYAEQQLDNVTKNNNSDEDRINKAYFKQQLAKALEQLPDRCREIFELAKFEGLSYGEIASYLELSTKTVENQMGRAMKKLREALLPFLKQVYEF